MYFYYFCLMVSVNKRSAGVGGGGVLWGGVLLGISSGGMLRCSPIACRTKITRPISHGAVHILVRSYM